MASAAESRPRSLASAELLALNFCLAGEEAGGPLPSGTALAAARREGRRPAATGAQLVASLRGRATGLARGAGAWRSDQASSSRQRRAVLRAALPGAARGRLLGGRPRAPRRAGGAALPSVGGAGRPASRRAFLAHPAAKRRLAGRGAAARSSASPPSEQLPPPRQPRAGPRCAAGGASWLRRLEASGDGGPEPKRLAAASRREVARCFPLAALLPRAAARAGGEAELADEEPAEAPPKWQAARGAPRGTLGSLARGAGSPPSQARRGSRLAGPAPASGRAAAPSSFTKASSPASRCAKAPGAPAAAALPRSRALAIAAIWLMVIVKVIEMTANDKINTSS